MYKLTNKHELWRALEPIGIMRMTSKNTHTLYTQYRLNAWARWAVSRGTPRGQGSYANLCMLRTACYLMFKHWFCWKYQYHKYIWPSGVIIRSSIKWMRNVFIYFINWHQNKDNDRSEIHKLLHIKYNNTSIILYLFHTTI